MAFSRGKVVILKYWADEFVIESKHFVKKLRIFYMITLLVSVELHAIGDHLFFGDVLESEALRLVLVVVVAIITLSLTIEEATWTSLCSRHTWTDRSIRNSSWSIWVTWIHTFTLVFQILKFGHNLTELLLSIFLLDRTLTYREQPLSIDKVACAWSSCEVTIDSLPVLLEVALDVLQSV